MFTEIQFWVLGVPCHSAHLVRSFDIKFIYLIFQPNDTQSPGNSPNKKLNMKTATPVHSPTKTHSSGKRKSTTSNEQSSPSEKKNRIHDKDKEKQGMSPFKKKEKDRMKKKKKSQEGTIEGKVKKKKKKRKEEAKMLRRKLVLRACNTAVKASKRKLKLAEKAKKDKGENGEHNESITSILEGLTTKRSVGRPRKIDTAEAEQGKDKKKDSYEKDKTKPERKQQEKAVEPSAPLTRTRSPETRSTRSNPRPESQLTKIPTKETESTPNSETPPQKLLSKKERRSSSSKKKYRMLKKKTRSETRLQGLQKPESSTRESEGSPEVKTHEPMHRTRSLPLIQAPSKEQAPRPQSALKRTVSALSKSLKKPISTTPETSTNTVEKKGRGRPPGKSKLIFVC